jgi:hypothetical protein
MRSLLHFWRRSRSIRSRFVLALIPRGIVSVLWFRGF